MNLSVSDYVRVRLEIEPPRRVVDFTTPHEAIIDGEIYPVVRYDCAHGRPHRDLLDARGRNLDKLWFSWSLSYAEIVQRAFADLRENWQRYRRDFIQRMP